MPTTYDDVVVFVAVDVVIDILRDRSVIQDIGLLYTMTSTVVIVVVVVFVIVDIYIHRPAVYDIGLLYTMTSSSSSWSLSTSSSYSRHS